MSHIISNIWNWLDSPRSWATILYICVFSVLFRKSWTALAGWDVKWDKFEFHDKHKKSDWINATTRRYSWLRLGLLFYVLWVGATLWWLGGFTWTNLNLSVYFTIATLWLLTAPVRNIWLIATVRKAEAKRGEKNDLGLWEEVSQYYEDGFRRRGEPSTEPWFHGRLKILNHFQKFRFVFRIFSWWGVLGVLAEMAMSLLWPFFMGAAIFWYLEEAEDESEHQAYWRSIR